MFSAESIKDFYAVLACRTGLGLKNAERIVNLLCTSLENEGASTMFSAESIKHAVIACRQLTGLGLKNAERIVNLLCTYLENEGAGTMPRSSQDIRNDLARMQRELDKALEEEKGQWPRKLTLCYTPQEDVRQKGKQLGLCGNACEQFADYVDEYCIELLVDRDGKVRNAALRGE